MVVVGWQGEWWGEELRMKGKPHRGAVSEQGL